MLLMSEGLADRIIFSHDGEDEIEKLESEVTDPVKHDQNAIIQFVIDAEVVRCIVKKMILTTDSFSATFVAVPSLPLRLKAQTPVHCTLTCGGHLLDFDLRNFYAEWDNTEGKQLCTIISKIEQQLRSSG